jgi:hypothetical protein
MDAITEDPWECHQALRTGDHDVFLSGRVIPVPRNPDRRQRIGSLERRRTLGHGFYNLQQGSYADSLFVKSIGSYPGRYTIAGERAAHGNHLHCGKSSSYHGEQFEAGHAWHIEVRQKNLGSFLPDLAQCREPVYGRSHTISRPQSRSAKVTFESKARRPRSGVLLSCWHRVPFPAHHRPTRNSSIPLGESSYCSILLTLSVDWLLSIQPDGVPTGTAQIPFNRAERY